METKKSFENNQPDKEKIMEYVCDSLCRYPRECRDEYDLEDKCSLCNLYALLESKEEKELQTIVRIIFDMTSEGKDCDICPCSFMLGDNQGCMRESGEDCLQAIKRDIKRTLESAQHSNTEKEM